MLEEYDNFGILAIQWKLFRGRKFKDFEEILNILEASCTTDILFIQSGAFSKEHNGKTRESFKLEYTAAKKG